MMRALRLMVPALALAVAWLAHLDVQAQQPPPPRAPHHWLREIEAIEARLLKGDTKAPLELQVAIAEAARDIQRLDATTLQEPRNVRAIFSYALSGGESRTVRKLLGQGTLNDTDKALAKGVLAFAEGRLADAEKALQKFNARDLPPSLGGRLALVQSIVTSKKDAPGAMKLLDDARLIAAGTLVEEAALRRQVTLSASLRDQNRFERSSGTYVRRHRTSVYAPQFKQQFCTAAATFDYPAGSDRLERLKAIVEVLDEADRLGVYLTLAEKAALEGNMALTAFAAKRSSDLSVKGSPEKARADVYGAVTQVASEEVDAAVARLNSIDPATLSPAENALREAALNVARVVRQAETPDLPSLAKGRKVEAPPPAHGAAEGADKGAPNTAAAEPEDKELDDVLSSAKTSLNAADTALRTKGIK